MGYAKQWSVWAAATLMDVQGGSLATGCFQVETVRLVLTALRSRESVRTVSAAMNSPELPEIDQAISRIIDGEKTAVRAVYQWFGKLLYSVAYKILQSPSDAEECVQDVFLSLWNHADALKGKPGKTLPWLIRTTRNRAIDQIRKTKRRLPAAERMQSEHSEAEQRQPVVEDNALDALVGRERAQRVRNSIESLPDEQRVAIRLAYFEGLSQSEIAKSLDESLGTIKSRTRRAMMRLRKELEGENA